jgi:glycosyltransferase involved in cell wall biosynthesis
VAGAVGPKVDAVRSGPDVITIDPLRSAWDPFAIWAGRCDSLELAFSSVGVVSRRGLWGRVTALRLPVGPLAGGSTRGRQPLALAVNLCSAVRLLREQVTVALRAIGRVNMLFVKKSKYIPEVYGGVETATHGLCELLKRRFHSVAVVAVTSNYEQQTGCRRAATRIREDFGYPVYLAARLGDALRQAMQERAPDVVILQEFDSVSWREVSPILAAKPVLFYHHSIYPELDALFEDPSVRARKLTRFLCNSNITSRYAERFGIKTKIIPPFFGIEKYKGARRLGNNIVMVSIQYSKGVDIALEIARRRTDQSFIFIESWSRSPEEAENIRREMKSLTNVAILPSTLDLSEIFTSAKLLLMPSRLEEGWGRTATEAQLCGIPVLASNRGNLSKTVGPGGRTLDLEAGLDVWLSEFDRMTRDPEYFEELSRAAREHGNRVLAGLSAAVSDFVQALYSVIENPPLYVRVSRELSRWQLIQRLLRL